MANDVRIRTQVTGAKQATGEIKGLHDAFTRLQTQGAKGFGIGVGASVTTAALGMVGGALSGVTDFMGESIEAASNLNESLSKSSVVFGENADDIEAWAETGAKAFGLSKQAALEAAGTYGNLFQAFGVGRQEATKMSTTLVELAADLASFNNTSIEDALIALRSGLSGETEPLKRYGIALSDARMRQTLMEAGIKDLGATLTPLQKSQAAYTLILKDSTLAQGDFARTSEDLANKQRTVAAELENLKAEVGNDLLPAQLAWEKGNLDLIRSTRVLGDIMHAGETDRDAMVDDMESLVRVTSDAAGPFGFLADILVDETEKARDAATAADDQTDAINDLTRASKGAKIPMEGVVEATESAADAFRKAQRPGSTLRGLLRDLGYEAGESEDAISDLSGTIADELFGDAINAGNEARLKEEIKDLRKQRAEVEKNTPKWKELSGEIAENEQSLWELHYEQAKQKGPRALLDFLLSSTRQFRRNNAAIDDEIASLRKLLSLLGRADDLGVITIGRYSGKTIPGFASGVKNFGGGLAVVGEDGPELVNLPTGTDVIPSGGGAPTPVATGGAPTMVPIPVPMSWTPAQQAAWANEAGPAMVRWMQQRGMISRGGAF